MTTIPTTRYLLLLLLPTVAFALGEVRTQGTFKETFRVEWRTTRTLALRCPTLTDFEGKPVAGQLLDGKSRWQAEHDKSLYRGIELLGEGITDDDTYVVTYRNGAFNFPTEIEVTLIIECKYTVYVF